MWFIIRFGMFFSRGSNFMRKKVRIIAIVTIITFTIICGAVTGFFWMKNKYFKMHTITEKSEYRQWQGVFNDEPILFPNKLDLLDVKEYKYKYEENIILDPDSEYILLSVKYNKDAFNTEIKRMCSIKDKYHEVKYSENEFDYPALVVNDKGHNYHFALLDKKNSLIHYLFIQFPPDFEGEKYVGKVMLDYYED